MAKYEYKGRKYEFPDYIPEEQALRIMQQDSAGAMQGGGSQQQAPRQPSILDRPRDAKITADDLRHDPRWIQANRILYRALEGDDKGKSDDEIHDLALREQALISYNTIHMAETANSARKFTPEQKKALAFAMEAYDRTSNDWTIAGNTAVSIIGDPLGWLPIGRMAGLATKTAPVGKFLSREALLQFLKRGIDTGVEGAIGAGVQNAIKQDIEKSVGVREETDLGELATDAAIGFGAGKILGGAADVVAGRFAARKAAGEAADAIPSTMPSEDPQGLTEALPATGVADEVVPPSNAFPEAPTASSGIMDEVVPTSLVDDAVPTPVRAAVTAEDAVPNASMIDDAVPSPTGMEPAPVAQGVDQVADASVRAVEEPTITLSPEGQSIASKIVSVIEDVAANSGGRLIYRTKEGLGAAVEEASNLLRSIGINDANDVVETLRRTGFTLEQQNALEGALSKASTQINAAITEAQRAGASLDELDKLAAIAEPIVKADMAMSSKDAVSMVLRKGEFVTGAQRAKATVADYEAEVAKEAAFAKATPEDRKAEAYARLASDFERYLSGVKEAPVVKELDELIEEAFKDGDLKRAVSLSLEKQALVEVAAEEQMEAAGMSKQAIEAANSMLRYLTSYIKNVVFSPKTLLVNAVWPAFETFARPIVSASVDSFSAESRREMASTFYAMWKVKGQALQAAKFAFAHNTTLLTGEIDKFEVHTRLPNLTIPEKLRVTLPGIGEIRRVPVGSVLEVFSRSMMFSDEFFSQLLYRGRTEGQAAFDAYVQASQLTARVIAEAKEKGLTGKAYKQYVDEHGIRGKKLKAYVQSRIDQYIKQAYKSEATDPHTVDLLRKSGVRKGFSGDALEDYIVTQLGKYKDILAKAASQDGRDFVNDALLRRAFSGKSLPSSTAKFLEGKFNQYPIFQIFGQLFFRTPLRAFEQGARLTPGLNLVSPKFLSDLSGAAGTPRDKFIKAQGDALLSYAVGMSFALAYATGTITGSGPKDFKQRRNLENTGWKANSIKTDDGWFSFRNIDPLATPYKIMANALDKLGELRERKGIGEDTENDEIEAIDYFKTGLAAIGQAFSDANLTEGVNQSIELVEMLTNDETKDNAWYRFFAEKVKLLIPNVIRQSMDLEAALTGDQNPLPDARTWEQYMDGIINPGGGSTPPQYDALGNKRVKTSSLWGILGVDWVSNDMLQTGKTKEQKEVLQALSDIEKSTGVVFSAPYVNRTYLGGLDLREQMTEDGKSTLYDRWMEYYRDSGVDKALYQAIKSNASVGTPETKGIMVDTVRGIINDFREQAFAKMMAEEQKISEQYFMRVTREQQTLEGDFDDRFIQDYQ